MHRLLAEFHKELTTQGSEITKISMELNCWVLIITINLLFATDVLGVKKSKLEAKFNALDSLVRGELYFLKDTIETGRQERKELIKKLNETLEFLEMSTDDMVPIDKIQVDTNKGGIQKELKTLSEKLEQNNNAISQLAESQLRTKRGLIGEKKARKADAAGVVTELIQIQRTLNDLSNTQQEIIKHQNNLANNINVIRTKTDALQNTIIDLTDKSDMLEQTLKDELSRSTKMTNNTTQQLVIQVSNIAKAVEATKEAVAPKLYCNNQLYLDACLQKSFMSIIKILGSVKLAGGSNSREGRVEIDYQGRHGTVCDDDWDNNDAKVVCRMLGFTGGTALQGTSHLAGHSFGDGTGDILLDNVYCTGDELSIFACKHHGIGVENCSHDEDAGVRCYP